MRDRGGIGKKVAIVGAGSYACSLAISLHRNGIVPMLWCHHPGRASRLNRTRVIPQLPSVVLPEGIECTSDLDRVIMNSAWTLIAIPSVALSERLDDPSFTCLLKQSRFIVNACKGFAVCDGFAMWFSEILKRQFNKIPIGQLSGPTFAHELATGKLSALALSSSSKKLSQEVQVDLSSNVFRVYVNSDIRGTEIGGALKNIIAIACGIVDGMQLGDNARSALLTRGLAEITRLGLKAGARAKTFIGLSGVGDLILTATCDTSRNRRFGLELGRIKTSGDRMEKILKRSTLVEGYRNSGLVVQLQERYGVELPIMHAVYRILHLKERKETVMQDLMKRPFTDE